MVTRGASIYLLSVITTLLVARVSRRLARSTLRPANDMLGILAVSLSKRRQANCSIRRNPQRAKILRLTATLCMPIASLFLYLDIVSFSIAGSRFDERAIYLLSTGLDGFNFQNAHEQVVITLLFVPAIFGLFTFFRRRLSNAVTLFIFNVCLVTVVMCSGVSRWLCSSVTYGGLSFPHQNMFDHYYRVPSKITRDGAVKYNLVVLYTESIESAFFNAGVFPGLLPNLKRIGKTMDNFTKFLDTGGLSWCSFTMVKKKSTT